MSGEHFGEEDGGVGKIQEGSDRGSVGWVSSCLLRKWSL